MTVQAEYPEWEFHLEFDQMLGVKAGKELRIGRYWSVLGCLGFSLPSPVTFTGNFLVLFHIREKDRTFQTDLYAGIPIFYANFFEGRYVDWDDIIDSPYQGGLVGGGIRWAFRFPAWMLGLRTGIGAHLEWIDGARQEVKPIPEITLEVQFISRKNREQK